MRDSVQARGLLRQVAHRMCDFVWLEFYFFVGMILRYALLFGWITSCQTVMRVDTIPNSLLITQMHLEFHQILGIDGENEGISGFAYFV